MAAATKATSEKVAATSKVARQVLQMKEMVTRLTTEVAVEKTAAEEAAKQKTTEGESTEKAAAKKATTEGETRRQQRRLQQRRQHGEAMHSFFLCLESFACTLGKRLCQPFAPIYM